MNNQAGGRCTEQLNWVVDMKELILLYQHHPYDTHSLPIQLIDQVRTVPRARLSLLASGGDPILDTVYDEIISLPSLGAHSSSFCNL